MIVARRARTSRSAATICRRHSPCVHAAMVAIGGVTGGSLIKIGTGTLTLVGNNTYTGATTVECRHAAGERLDRLLEPDHRQRRRHARRHRHGRPTTHQRRHALARQLDRHAHGRTATSAFVSRSVLPGRGLADHRRPHQRHRHRRRSPAPCRRCSRPAAISAEHLHHPAPPPAASAARFGARHHQRVARLRGAALSYDRQQRDPQSRRRAARRRRRPRTQNQQNVANAINNFFNDGGALPPGFVTLVGLTGGDARRTR